MLVIKDTLQEYTKINYPDIKSKEIFVDIILYCLIAYSYYFGNSELYTKFIKYLLAFLFIRYMFNLITNYTYNDSKNHFQLNSYIGIFVLILFLGNFDLNIYTQCILIFLYALFTSAVYGYTTDNLLTVVLVYNLLQINF